eukprot:gene42671-54104_t
MARVNRRIGDAKRTIKRVDDNKEIADVKRASVLQLTKNHPPGAHSGMPTEAEREAEREEEERQEEREAAAGPVAAEGELAPVEALAAASPDAGLAGADVPPPPTPPAAAAVRYKVMNAKVQGYRDLAKYQQQEHSFDRLQAENQLRRAYEEREREMQRETDAQHANAEDLALAECSVMFHYDEKRTDTSAVAKVKEKLLAERDAMEARIEERLCDAHLQTEAAQEDTARARAELESLQLRHAADEERNTQIIAKLHEQKAELKAEVGSAQAALEEALKEVDKLRGENAKSREQLYSHPTTEEVDRVTKESYDERMEGAHRGPEQRQQRMERGGAGKARRADLHR